MATSLDFWFDYTCPYAYLASTRAQGIADRMGVPLTYQPILLGGIFKAVNQPQNLFASRHPARIAYDAQDLQRWARVRGMKLTMPSNHPMRSVEALRATLVTGCDPRVIAAFYRAYWVENREISSPEVMREVLGADADRVLAEISSESVKADLRARTERGIALGLFGVPTFIVDGKELYWGQDREAQIEGLAAPSGPDAPATGRVLEVHWDFSSPFAYFGCAQVEALARRTGATVKWNPILLGGLFKSLGGPEIPLATFPPAKYEWIMKDLLRWSAYWDLPLKWPSRFPTLSLKALRLYLALPEPYRAEYRIRTFRAFWAEDEDITDEGVLAACVGDEAVAREALAKSNADEVKAELRASTESAAKRGVFGVPTFFVGDEMFWAKIAWTWSKMRSGADLRAWLASASESEIEASLSIPEHLETTPPSDHLVGHHMIGTAALVRALDAIPVTAHDRVLDVGAGIGKLLALTHLLTGAAVRGIELQPKLVKRALPEANIIEGDARTATLTDATIVFLYCPFEGPVLEAVAKRLDQTSAIICAFGIDLPLSRHHRRPSDDFWTTIWDPVSR